MTTLGEAGELVAAAIPGADIRYVPVCSMGTTLRGSTISRPHAQVRLRAAVVTRARDRRLHRSDGGSEALIVQLRSSGSDAVSWVGSDKPLTVSAATHHSNVNYNLYEGTNVVGAPEVGLLRGHPWRHPNRGHRRR